MSNTSSKSHNDVAVPDEHQEELVSQQHNHDCHVVVMYACGTQVIRLGLGKKANILSQANSNSNKVRLT